MFGISFLELMVIFLLILVVMGPEKLPEVAQWMGKGLRELRKASNTLRHALTMEEFDVDMSSSNKLPTDASAPALKTNDIKADEGPASSPPDPTNADPSPAPPRSGLDQVDDQQFDQMLERQYQIQRTDLTRVELAAARSTDDCIAVAVEPALATSDCDTMAFSSIATTGEVTR